MIEMIFKAGLRKKSSAVLIGDLSFASSSTLRRDPRIYSLTSAFADNNARVDMLRKDCKPVELANAVRVSAVPE
jgi:hypothetical protein